jgi:hypothetical protein
MGGFFSKKKTPYAFHTLVYFLSRFSQNKSINQCGYWVLVRNLLDKNPFSIAIWDKNLGTHTWIARGSWPGIGLCLGYGKKGQKYLVMAMFFIQFCDVAEAVITNAYI